MNAKRAQPNRWGNNTRHLQQDDGRRAIIEAAQACFAQKGVTATTIDEIAKAAQITRRTVYHYFASKDAILEAAVEQHGCDAIREMLENLPPDLPFADLIVSSIAYLVENMPKQPFYRVQVSDKVGLQAGYFYFNLPKVQKAWLAAFQPSYIEALRQRTIHPDLHLEDILMWTGRLVLSFIQYPNPPTARNGIKAEVECFFGRALRAASHS
jgi:AcrR family transcriptional regulator